MKKIFCVCVLLVMVFAVGCGRSNDTVPTEINIGVLQMALDINLARALGFFDDLSVDVNFHVFDAGRDINLAIASGSIDFGMLGSPPATVAIATGIGVDVYWIHGIYNNVEALAIRTETGIQSFDDLHGATLGVTFGSTSHYSLLNALEMNNVRDFTLLDMTPPDIYAAWLRGDIDGAWVWMPVLSSLLNSGGHYFVTAGDMAEVGVVTANVGYVRRAFGQAHPEIVAEVVGALMRAHEVYNNDRQLAAETFAQMFGFSIEEATMQMDSQFWIPAEEQILPTHLGGEMARILKDTADFFYNFGSIERYPTLSLFTEAVNPSFIEVALNE